MDKATLLKRDHVLTVWMQAVLSHFSGVQNRICPILLTNVDIACAYSLKMGTQITFLCNSNLVVDTMPYIVFQFWCVCELCLGFICVTC